jgi:hypothetical protein
MSWKKKITENAAGTLRFIGYAFIIFDAIVLSAFTLWFTCKFLWQLINWLNKTIFSEPW